MHAHAWTVYHTLDRKPMLACSCGSQLACRKPFEVARWNMMFTNLWKTALLEML